MYVIFVYSRCGHCKALAPEFEQAAAVLRFNNPPITLAEVGKRDLLDILGGYGIHSHTLLNQLAHSSTVSYCTFGLGELVMCTSLL